MTFRKQLLKFLNRKKVKGLSSRGSVLDRIVIKPIRTSGDVADYSRVRDRSGPIMSLDEKGREWLIDLNTGMRGQLPHGTMGKESAYATMADTIPRTRSKIRGLSGFDEVGEGGIDIRGMAGDVKIMYDGKVLSKEEIDSLDRFAKRFNVSLTAIGTGNPGEVSRRLKELQAGMGTSLLLGGMVSREFGRSVLALGKGELTRNQMRQSMVRSMNRQSPQQAMDNLMNKVIPQAHLPVDMQKMVNALMDDMTATEFERFYKKYHRIVDEVFISSDGNLEDTGRYMIDGKVYEFEHDIPMEHKHQVIESFITSLAEFKGLTFEELLKRSGIDG